MVLAIHYGDSHRGFGQGLSGIDPGKTSADDDHVRPIVFLLYHTM